jgi:hypothetical protein
MGRGSSSTSAADISAGPSRRSVQRGAFDPANAVLRQLTAQAYSLIYGIAPTEDACENYIWQIQEASAGKAAGRGGRFIVSLNDLMDAATLAQGNSDEQRLAQTMVDNALWHIGHIAAEYDSEGRFASQWGDLMERYGEVRGPMQLDYLVQRGLLGAEKAAELRPQAGTLYRQAYASADKHPRWSALALMERASRAAEEIASATPIGPDAEEMQRVGSAEAAELIGKCQSYLNGGASHDHINRHGPSEATRLQAIASGFRSAEAARLNNELGRTGAIAAHRATVNRDVSAPPDRPVFVVGDARWLDQVMNYQGMITYAATETVAVNTRNKGIFLSTAAAEEAVAAHSRGDGGDILIHELVHNTQPKPQGKPLADRGAKAPGQLHDRHRTFESMAMEGATQARANHLRRQAGADPAFGNYAYPSWTTMVDVAAARTNDPDTFYTNYSITPTNQRASMLCQTLFGDNSETKQRQLVDRILPIMLAGDEQLPETTDAGVLSRYHQSLSQQFAAAFTAMGLPVA